MKCLYINLASADDRRRHVEASFAAHAAAGWELIRIPAYDKAEAAAEAGALTPAERACWRSHLRALSFEIEAGEDVLIIEDDTRFTAQLFQIAGPMLAAAKCDVLFTDLMPTDINLVAGLARRWPDLRQRGEFVLQDLARTGFIGASAYMVRGGARAALIEKLQDPQLQDLAYDIALGRLAQTGGIQARTCFPFLTAPSADADRSQIQSSALDFRHATVHAYRRLMVADRDLPSLRAEIAGLAEAHGDEGSSLMGAVLGALISPAFPDSY